VIVPTFGGRPVLERCLRALLGQSDDSFEVVVVDDGSSDGTADWVREAFPQVRVVAHPENRGFCCAVNEGIRASRGGVVALLNNDTEPEPGWLDALLAALEADPAVGYCASRMMRHDDPDRIDGAGDEYSRHGLVFRVGQGELDDGRFPAREVLLVSGGACAYRREVLDEVGLLDERLVAYYDEVDLGLRAWSAGWRGRYVPDSKVTHVGSWSERDNRSTMLTTRNSLLIVAKHWPGRLILRHLPWLAYGQLRNALWALRTGQGRAWAAGVASAARGARAMRASQSRRDATWRSALARDFPFGAGRHRST
jgi:GT2 family glycosyltransferase